MNAPNELVVGPEKMRLGKTGPMTFRIGNRSADSRARPVELIDLLARSCFIVTAGAARHVLELCGVVGGTRGKQRYARVVEKDRSDVFVLSDADTIRLTRDRSEYLTK